MTESSKTGLRLEELLELLHSKSGLCFAVDTGSSCEKVGVRMAESGPERLLKSEPSKSFPSSDDIISPNEPVKCIEESRGAGTEECVGL